MIASRLVPKTRLLLAVSKNPSLFRYVSEPVYNKQGYAARPFLADLSEYWMYAGGLSFAAFMYFVMSSPLSEITPVTYQKYHNQYSDKWYFLYPELENYVRKNFDKLKKEKVDPKLVMKEVYETTMSKNK